MCVFVCVYVCVKNKVPKNAFNVWFASAVEKEEDKGVGKPQGKCRMP